MVPRPYFDSTIVIRVRTLFVGGAGWANTVHAKRAEYVSRAAHVRENCTVYPPLSVRTSDLAASCMELELSRLGPFRMSREQTSDTRTQRLRRLRSFCLQIAE